MKGEETEEAKVEDPKMAGPVVPAADHEETQALNDAPEATPAHREAIAQSWTPPKDLNLEEEIPASRIEYCNLGVVLVQSRAQVLTRVQQLDMRAQKREDNARVPGRTKKGKKAKKARAKAAKAKRTKKKKPSSKRKILQEAKEPSPSKPKGKKKKGNRGTGTSSGKKEAELNVKGDEAAKGARKKRKMEAKVPEAEEPETTPKRKATKSPKKPTPDSPPKKDAGSEARWKPWFWL